MRGDRPFAYDLVIEYGAVSSRVVLLLRSAEAKPRFFTSVLESKLPILRSLIGLRKGSLVCVICYNYRARCAIFDYMFYRNFLQSSIFLRF